MNRRTVFATLALVSLVAAALLVVFNRGSAQESSLTIHVVERATTDVVTDFAEEGDSVGDLLTFANEVYDENNENLVGTDNGYCIRTAVGLAWECAWTLTLDDGQLMVEGSFMDVGDSVLAISGGTGAYQNARGQMTLHDRNGDATEYDFVYEIYDEASE